MTAEQWLKLHKVKRLTDASVLADVARLIK